MKARFLTVLMCGLLTGADADDLVRQEYTRLEGVWRFVLVEVDGNKQPEAPFPAHRIIILKDGRYAVVQGPKITRGVVKLDPRKTPKHFDVSVTTAAGQGPTILSIYELDDDTYKICSSLRSKERPAAFVSKPGSGTIFQVFHREKQDVKDAMTELDRHELTGDWQALAYALDGKKAKAEDLQDIKLSFDVEGKAEARRAGQVFVASTTKIDPMQNPPTIDITYTEGDIKGKIALGIYKIEGDVLTICRAAPDKTRPSQFASNPGSGHTLMAYKRDK